MQVVLAACISAGKQAIHKNYHNAHFFTGDALDLREEEEGLLELESDRLRVAVEGLPFPPPATGSLSCRFDSKLSRLLLLGESVNFLKSQNDTNQ